MNEHDESDSSVVPERRANETPQGEEELVEGRGPAKGNPPQHDAARTQRRPPAPSALERIPEAARRDRRLRFTALLHHIYDIDRLRAAYRAMRHDASAGIDGVTWEQYGQDLEGNLQDLSARLRRGAYRARPARRARIPKSGGQQRLIGVPVLKDEVVQRATVAVLQRIYEVDFLGFSYGFRPGRSQHMALDAVSVGIRKRKVSWVLDADIRGFFDTLDHGWLVKLLERRIADERVIRLIQKWLKAGVMEDGKRIRSEMGAVQGGKVQSKLKAVHRELRRRMHEPMPEQGRYVASVVRGHANYCGVPGNARAVSTFREKVIRIWRKTLSRRSQKGRIPWRRMERIAARHVSRVRQRYTNPDGHLASRTRGRSPVR